MRRYSLPFLAVFALACPLLTGQENSPADTSAPDPKVSTDALTLSLDPMTKDELETEAAAWLELLKAKATEIANLEIKALGGVTEDTKQRLVVLRNQKTELVKRTELVLEGYEVKGGDVEIAGKYVAAVKGIKTGVNDVGSRIHAFNTWLASRDGGIKLALHILQFIGVMVVFWILAAFVSRFIRRALEKQLQFSALLKDFINKMSRRVVFFIGLIVALGTIGVNVGAALALIGGGAFIIGLALQDTLSNFANGIMLLIYRPFDVGSAVEVGGIKGKVDSVSMVSTTILTFDNQKVLVPNKKVWGEIITNITGMDTRRVDMLFGIGYDDDMSLAQEIIERVVSEHQLVLKEPEPNIGVHELGDSSVNFRCWAWALTSDFLTVRTEITRRVKEEFDKAGISIPFPQRDVHLYTKEKPVITIEESKPEE
jgi:small conductance mechanosensitive channel